MAADPAALDWTINSDISSNPAHNSVLTLGFDVPTPLMQGEQPLPDAQGQVKTMLTRCWAGLIGKTEASDQELIEWAKSFSTPPSPQVTGARIKLPSYSPERRALRLVVDSPSVEIKLKPGTITVNPVFELEDAPEVLTRVTLDEQVLSSRDYAWDGKNAVGSSPHGLARRSDESSIPQA